MAKLPRLLPSKGISWHCEAGRLVCTSEVGVLAIMMDPGIEQWVDPTIWWEAAIGTLTNEVMFRRYSRI